MSARLTGSLGPYQRIVCCMRYFSFSLLTGRLTWICSTLSQLALQSKLFFSFSFNKNAFGRPKITWSDTIGVDYKPLEDDTRINHPNLELMSSGLNSTVR